MSAQLGFAQLIEPITVDDFFATYFEQRCLHVPGAPDRFRSVLDLERVERVLWQQPGRYDELLSVLKSGVRQVPPRTGAFKWAQDQFNAGASIVLDSIGTCDVEFAALQRRLEDDLVMDINTNVYLTPASQQTFPVHFDIHDTFVIHLHGTKHWRVHAPIVELPLRHHQRQIDLAKAGPVVAEYELRPGHVLYIPRGVPHCAIAAGDTSLHVTLGLYPIRYVDLLHHLVSLAADVRPTLRAAVPRRELTGDLAALARVLDEVANLAAAPPFRRMAVDRWHEHAATRAAALPDAGLVGSYVTHELGLDDRVERCHGVKVHVSELADKARIAFGGYQPFPGSDEATSLQGPRFLTVAFEFIARADAPFCVRELPGDLSDGAKLLLVQQLLSAGLLRRVTAPA